MSTALRSVVYDRRPTQDQLRQSKSIGDGYMAACGLPDPDHVAYACDLALAMVAGMPALNAELGTRFQLLVGFYAGSAVAGMVGASKSSYDVWSDMVNLAAQLESNGAPGVVVTSAAVVTALLGRHTFANRSARRTSRVRGLRTCSRW